MQALLIHLSDIHLKSSGNSISSKVEELIRSIQNYALVNDYLFLLLTGDIAYSGLDIEYTQAKIILERIRKHIEHYTNKKIEVILIPGNHDCNLSVRDKTRDKDIQDIISAQDITTGNQVETCCKVQNAYFKFTKGYLPSGKILFSDPLLNIIDYSIGQFNIIFNCYNTAWLSQKQKNTPIFFPIRRYSQEYFRHKADLRISLLHHPYTWVPYTNSRDVKRHIEDTSDLVLTGHEHIPSNAITDNLQGNVTGYFEGAILQDNEDDSRSGFNLLFINFQDGKHKVLNFKWAKDFYSYEGSPDKWTPYKSYVGIGKYHPEISKGFLMLLNDSGGNFSHPNKGNLSMDDLFIYPQLRNLKIARFKGKVLFNDIISSESLANIKKQEHRFLLAGAVRSGKSSLLHYLYKQFHKNNYIPVLLQGREIKSPQISDLEKLIQKTINFQYSNCNYEIYYELENSKR